MATGKTKTKSGTKITNDDRHCKKASKKHPGVAPKAHPGKTIDGYTPAKIALRAARRNTYAA